MLTLVWPCSSTLFFYVQAIALLHPKGPTAAAADEAREAAEAELAAAAAARHPSKVAKLALRQGLAMGEGTPSGTPRTGSGVPPRLGSAAFPGTQLAGPADTPSCTDADDFQVRGHFIVEARSFHCYGMLSNECIKVESCAGNL